MNYSVISVGTGGGIEFITERTAALGLTADIAATVRRQKEAFSGIFGLASKSDILILAVGNEEDSFFVKKTLSELTGKALKTNEAAVLAFERYQRYNSLKIISNKTKDRIVSFPEGFVCVGGDGILSGAYCVNGKKSVIILPTGSDLPVLFERCLFPVLSGKKNAERKVMNFKLYGADEVELNAKLSELPKSKKYTISVRSDATTDTLVNFVFLKGAEQELIDETIRNFVMLLGDRIYADADVSLAEKAVDYLIVRKEIVGVAESFTGGMIASKLVDVAGVSGVFNEGLVTYSNDSKRDRLGVKAETLEKYGAVSDQTAYEMALGLLNLGNGCAVATTGIAGPGGGSPEKPVGLCYYAVGTREGIHVHRKLYTGSRNEIRKQASNDALFALIGILK